MTAQEADKVRVNSHIFTCIDLFDDSRHLLVPAGSEGRVLSRRTGEESRMVYFGVEWSCDGRVVVHEISALNAAIFLRGRHRK